MEELYKGYTIKIEQDENPESPREWDNLGVMYCYHPRYNLGDKQLSYNGYESYQEMIKQNTEKSDIVLPLFLYDHSGISISTTRVYPYNDQFDSSTVGFIVATKEKIMAEYKVKRISKKLQEKILKVLMAEVETYDQYLTGDVWGYSIEESGDSCWGFYGRDEAMKEAKSVVDYQVKEDQKKRETKTRAYIINQVPLLARI